MVKSELTGINYLIKEEYDKAFEALTNQADNDQLMAYFFLSVLYSMEEEPFYDFNEAINQLYRCYTHHDFEGFFDTKTKELDKEAYLKVALHIEKMSLIIIKKISESKILEDNSNTTEQLQKMCLIQLITYQNNLLNTRENNTLGQKIIPNFLHVLISVDFQDGYYYYGRSFEEGIGIAQDYQRAFFFYEKAVNHDNKLTYFRLSKMYKKGLYVDKSEEISDDYLEEAAYSGVLLATKEMMKKIMTQYDYNSRYYMFLDLLVIALNKYDQDAQNYAKHINEMISQKMKEQEIHTENKYYFTDIIKEVISKSDGSSYYIPWFISGSSAINVSEESRLPLLKEAAIKYEHDRALFSLGMYYYRKDNEESYKKALEYFEQSANKDYIPAVKMMLYCIDEGIGTKFSIDEKLKWMEIFEQLTGSPGFELTGAIEE